MIIGDDGGDWLARPSVRTWRCRPHVSAAPAFHAGLPGYAPTPLVELPAIARELDVCRVFLKDESSRFGLPAFKVLGVSWAVCQALAASLGAPITQATLDGLRDLAATLAPITLVTATDGNHGRALARIAALLDLPAHIFVPDHLNPKAIAAIEGEGAHVTRIAGSYDDAVRAVTDLASGDSGALLIQDTAWPGYETVPAWIVEGYATLFLEADAQLAAVGAPAIDLVALPTGVGSLLQAALQHYRDESRPEPPVVLSVEPENAAGVLASVRAGGLSSVETGWTVMSGLNCETPSSLAWPLIEHGLDACVAVPDTATILAMAELEDHGVLAGPSGAAALAGACAVLDVPERRAALGITSEATVLLVCTEGRASGAV